MFVRINYSNGYCGCDAAEEEEAYYENCTFDIEEITEEEYQEEK